MGALRTYTAADLNRLTSSPEIAWGTWKFELAARRLREQLCITDWYKARDRQDGMHYWRLLLASEMGNVERYAKEALDSNASYMHEVNLPPEVLASLN